MAMADSLSNITGKEDMTEINHSQSVWWKTTSICTRFTWSL
jgi:hypothetical protein